MAHILTSDEDERQLHLFGSYIQSLDFGGLYDYFDNFFLYVHGTTGKALNTLVTWPTIGFLLWKYRADERMWRTAAVGAAAAGITVYALWTWAYTSPPTTLSMGMEMIEEFPKQFALFTGYNAVLVFSCFSAWLLLAANLFFDNGDVRRAGISTLIVFAIFGFAGQTVWYVYPLRLMWWD